LINERELLVKHTLAVILRFAKSKKIPIPIEEQRVRVEKEKKRLASIRKT